MRGDPGLVPELMTRIYGSSDLFPDDLRYAYRPYQSVNYVTSHDGFTLYDLVSYQAKNNWANGHNNEDGASDYSSNCGWEGDTDVPPDVLRLRKQQVKNFCCLLFLSNGTPMFRMGDEFLHSQGGNNNPYNQDNETSWLDWSRLEANQDIFRFFKMMIAFRKAHPSVGRSRFWRDDIHWYGTDRDVDISYRSGTLSFCLHGASQDDIDIYGMINACRDSLQFHIHERPAGQWKRLVDTALPSPDDFAEPSGEAAVSQEYYTVQGRSVVVLVAR
jgi:glycogen operon protein